MLLTALMPMVERVAGTRFWSLYRGMRRMAELPGERQVQRQVDALRETIEHAAKHVPWWRERVERLLPLPTQADKLLDLFRSLPVTTKHELKTLPLEQLTAGSLRDQWRYGSSAGTVDRVTVVTDFRKRDYVRAANLRMIDSLIGNPLGARIVEIPPDACNVVCALRDEGPLELWRFVKWAWGKGILFHGDTRSDLRGRIEREWIVRQDTLEPLSVAAYDQLQEQLDAHLDRISLERPNILRGLPHYLLWLAERAHARGVNLTGVRAMLPYGLMSQSMAKRTSQLLGIPFRDYYGTSEIGPIALQSPGETGMHVYWDLVLVEIVDEDYQPLPPNRVGKILITDLRNRAMPLVRYEIGDYGRWLVNTDSTEPTSTDVFDWNRTARLEVMGRAAEVVKTADMVITPRQVMDIVYADQHVLNACLNCPERLNLDHKQRITLQYCGGQPLTPDVIAQLATLLGCEGSVTARQVSYLRPESSGKYRTIKVGLGTHS